MGRDREKKGNIKRGKKKKGNVPKHAVSGAWGSGSKAAAPAFASWRAALAGAGGRAAETPRPRCTLREGKMGGGGKCSECVASTVTQWRSLHTCGKKVAATIASSSLVAFIAGWFGTTEHVGILTPFLH